MSSLTLLLGVLAGIVATATSEQGLSCRQEIHSELIRDLWNQTRQIIHTLPKEASFDRRHRFLPKFCNNCSKPAIGWLEIREMTDVYQRSVFSSEEVQKLLPPHYSVLLHRLQHRLQHCVSSSKDSKHHRSIKKMERKINKCGDRGALKAMGEFVFVLRWIDEQDRRPL
ncbi:interleukin-26 [Menidia menidia]